MSDFDNLLGEIEDGRSGKNKGLPMGFERLNRYISIRKRIYTLVFGSTGSGKSSFVHNAFILNPFDYYYKNLKDRSEFTFKVFLFSMERGKTYTLAKWLSRKIFLDNGGAPIPIPKMLGWWKQKLTEDEYKLIQGYRWYVDELLKVVIIIEGPQNPTGIYKTVKAHADANGVTEHPTEFTKIYKPNNPHEIVIPIVDHLGITKSEKGQGKKEAIDKVSEYFQIFRDLYGYSPVAVSQVNRDLSNPAYRKEENVEPNLDQVKESGRPAEDSDCVISLFDPLRYKTQDANYQVENFVNSVTGGNYFRSVKILKNTYGESDIRVGMGFYGETGQFKELPRKDDMGSFDYNDLFDGSYFLI